MLSPEQTVQKLAFQGEKSGLPPTLTPLASPPASAPPPPPPVKEAAAAEEEVHEEADENDPLVAPEPPNANQKGSRAVKPPTIRTEDYEKHKWIGDASLLPNVGLTNSYDYSICAVHESVYQLRYIILTICLATFLLVLWTWVWQLFTLQWARLVISLYLALLAVLLGLSELFALMTPLRTRVSSFGEDGESPTDSTPSNERSMQKRLQDSFGFLYHPVGKPCLLLFMATLCWVLTGIFEFFLGTCYFLAAIAILFLGREREFRQIYYPSQRYLSRNQNEQAGTDYGAIRWSYFASTGRTENSALIQTGKTPR